MENHTEPTGQIDAIILASGFSKRFGAQNKLLAPLCGMPLVEYPLRLVCGTPGIHTVWLVCASNAVAEVGNAYPVQILRNTNAQRGQAESIRLAVRASDADSYLFLTADQPLLDARTLQLVMAAAAEGRIVQPAFGKRAGSPTLFSKTFRPQLLALPDGEGARGILRRHPGAVHRVQVHSPHVLEDVDTPEDLQRAATWLGGHTETAEND